MLRRIKRSGVARAIGVTGTVVTRHRLHNSARANAAHIFIVVFRDVDVARLVRRHTPGPVELRSVRGTIGKAGSVRWIVSGKSRYRSAWCDLANIAIAEFRHVDI